MRPLGAGWLLKKLVFLGFLGLKKLSHLTVLIGLSLFLVILYNTPILKFPLAIFCNFHLEPKLWRHKWRNFWFCKSCRRAMRFSTLDSSEDFMARCGLRFCLSLIVSELWRHQWRHNDVISTFPLHKHVSCISYKLVAWDLNAQHSRYCYRSCVIVSDVFHCMQTSHRTSTEQPYTD